ncbi:MAG: PmoA family protein [Verrucomicrobiota bacterium]
MKSLGVFFALGAVSMAGEIALKQDESSVDVTVNGEPFATVVFGDGKVRRKPVIYPVFGPEGQRMTRDYPFKETEGEADDHPHHESMWFNHGDANGVSFWHVNEGSGTIETREVLRAEDGIVEFRNEWVMPDGEILISDVTKFVFSVRENGDRVIDHYVTLTAEVDDLHLGDEKDSGLGIRMHPNLRLKNDKKRGVSSANGKVRNSDGVDTYPEVWGKRAKWVGYWGEIDGKTYGVSVLDHPSNRGFPTVWHARDYGLLAANPWGVGAFKLGPEGAGAQIMKKGETLSLKYRFVFHRGDTAEAKIDDIFSEWSKN